MRMLVHYQAPSKPSPAWSVTSQTKPYTLNHYDYIIIGSGMGGGTLAAKLAPSGKSILILERGGYIPREPENWSTKAVFIDGRYAPDEEWMDKDRESFRPGTHYCVGGNSKFYGSALLRMRERDFEEIEHIDGISPAWPLTYEDFKDWYLEAERMYHVHGERGSDPTEPAEERPYPLPPIAHEPRIQEVYDDIREQGVRAFPLPMGVKLGTKPGQSPYILDRFDGYPDASEAKADAHVCAIKPALEYDNVRLEPHCLVQKIETSADGKRATAVQVARGGVSMRFTGDTIVVSCGAVNSAALLLRSRNEHHPNGLGNSSDLLGRNYMAHCNSAMLALSTKPNPTRFGKTFAINDYYFGDGKFGYPLGHIQMLGKSDAAQIGQEAPAFAPGFTLEYVAEHALDFWLTSEDLPLAENRVTLTDDDQIQLSYTETNMKAHEHLREKLKDILRKVDDGDGRLFKNKLYFSKDIPLASVGHQCGTAVFGTDPSKSVLDLNCKMHDLDNLYVVDSSFFPSSGAVNPGLTIAANAIRVAAHLME